MRTKTRTTTQIKPGMVIRSGCALAGTPSHAFREVATVTKPTPYAERLITFTDGTRVRRGNTWEFEVARSKAVRNAAKASAALLPGHALADMLALFGAYARTAVA